MKSDVLKLHGDLKAKMEKLEKRFKNPKYACTPTFRPNLHSDRGIMNIRSASPAQLVSATKSMILHELANEKLGMDVLHDGYSAEAWMNDFKVRKGVIEYNDTMKELQKLEAELKGIMNSKEKRTVALDGLTDRFKNL